MTGEITRVEFTPATITADFAAMNAELDRALEPYQGVTLEAVQEMPEKDVKACAKDLRAMRKSIEDGRKGVKREYNKPLNAFELEVKKLVARIDMHLELFKQVEAANEERRRANRMEVLREAYESFLAGNGMAGVADVIPAERLVERQWLNKSFAESKAVGAMEDRAAGILSDWRALHEAKVAHPVEVEAVFIDTLDLGAALSYERECAERDARLEAMRHAELAAVEEAAGYREAAIGPTTDDGQQAPLCYVVRMLMTDAQREALKSFMRQHGIRGDMGLMTAEQAASFMAKMEVA